MVHTSGSYEMCQDAGRSVRELVCKVSKCLSVRGYELCQKSKSVSSATKAILHVYIFGLTLA